MNFEKLFFVVGIISWVLIIFLFILNPSGRQYLIAPTIIIGGLTTLGLTLFFRSTKKLQTANRVFEASQNIDSIRKLPMGKNYGRGSSKED